MTATPLFGDAEHQVLTDILKAHRGLEGALYELGAQNMA